MVLVLPSVQVGGKDKYFLFPIYDAWTNVVESPGTRTKEKFPNPGAVAIAFVFSY